MPRRTTARTSSTDRDAATIAKALGHPVRVRILRLLLAHDACFCGEICDHLPLAQSTVSQHLKVLREAGLVQSTACGRATGYSVDRARLGELETWLREFAGEVSR